MHCAWMHCAWMHRALMHRALMHRALMHRALPCRALMRRALMHCALMHCALMHCALMHCEMLRRAMPHCALRHCALPSRWSSCCWLCYLSCWPWPSDGWRHFWMYCRGAPSRARHLPSRGEWPCESCFAQALIFPPMLINYEELFHDYRTLTLVRVKESRAGTFPLTLRWPAR